MFNGFFDIALADEDLIIERAQMERERIRSAVVLLGALGIAGLWSRRLWMQKARAPRPS